MSDRGNNKCPYIRCYLPDDNKKYWVQLAYLTVSIIILISDSKEFTFFAILMFTAPILLDLSSTDLKGTTFTKIRNVFIFLNAMLAVFCIAGVVGFFVDNTNTFSVSMTSMIFAGFTFDKKFLLVPMVFDLLIPVIMYYACPSKKMKETIKHSQKQRKEGK